jgi:hypothetical protein
VQGREFSATGEEMSGVERPQQWIDALWGMNGLQIAGQ